MTLDKAIEILKERYRIRDPFGNPDHDEALGLGIEALKDKKAEREVLGALSRQLLPGETKA